MPVVRAVPTPAGDQMSDKELAIAARVAAQTLLACAMQLRKRGYSVTRMPGAALGTEPPFNPETTLCIEKHIEL